MQWWEWCDNNDDDDGGVDIISDDIIIIKFGVGDDDSHQYKKLYGFHLQRKNKADRTYILAFFFSLFPSEEKISDKKIKFSRS